MVIYKYPLPTETRFTLDLPRNFQILSLQVQGGTPCIWAAVNADAPTLPVPFRVLLTGEEIPFGEYARLTYVGTFQDDWFVGHVYYESVAMGRDVP